jgi:molybdate transport system ATP-binding protein
MIEINFSKKLSGINLEISTNIENFEFVSIFGKSGAGKTTFLRILAGLETPDSGSIIVDGEVWFDSSKKINILPQKRGIGFVFQDYALFNNMSVRENLEFVIKDNRIIDELLEIVELKKFQNRKPTTLSGGQKQRVALARALVKKPKILLFDEPLSALDNEIRIKLQDVIVKLHEQFQTTSFLVSHDISEIFKLSNRVLTIENGHIVKNSSPYNTFAKQKTSGKFSFVGEVLEIKKGEILSLLTIQIGSNIVQTAISNDEIIEESSKVLISTKAFNPIVMKIAH